MKKLIIPALLVTLFYSSASLASTGGEGDGAGIMGYLLLGFFGMIIVTQLAPGTVLFFSLIKGLFCKTKVNTSSSTR